MNTLFIPGATTSGDVINIPSGAANIGSIDSVNLIRPYESFSLADHDIETASFGGITNDLGHDGSSPAQLETAAGTNVTIGGAVSAHSSSGTDPIVAANATKDSERGFTLDVNTEDGDIIELIYTEAGQYPAA